MNFLLCCIHIVSKSIACVGLSDAINISHSSQMVFSRLPLPQQLLLCEAYLLFLNFLDYCALFSICLNYLTDNSNMTIIALV